MGYRYQKSKAYRKSVTNLGTRLDLSTYVSMENNKNHIIKVAILKNKNNFLALPSNQYSNKLKIK